jgi:hypothetical protein
MKVGTEKFAGLNPEPTSQTDELWMSEAAILSDGFFSFTLF